MQNVVIIGSGVVGAAIAYKLSENPNFNITLIDEQTPASGSTGAALGVLMAVSSRKTKGRAWKLRQISIARYQTLIPELESLTGMNIPCNRQGVVVLCFDKEDEAKLSKLCKKRAYEGYQLEMWNLEQLRAKCPQINQNKVICAVYSPQDQQVNPTILTKALVAGASLRGVNCIFGQKVHNFVKTDLNDSNNRHCSQVNILDGEIKADWVILAAGMGSSNLIASLSQKIDIAPVLGKALLLKHDKIIGNPDFQPVITGNDVHIAPIGNGEYWIGATLEFPNHQGEFINNEELLEKVRQEAISFCPDLAEATIMLSWSGKRPCPEAQSSPIIEKLSGYDNVILATGHYRNGILLAPATAKAVYDMINRYQAIL